MKGIVFLPLFFVVFNGFAQNLQSRLASAVTVLEKDKQFEHAMVGMYVVETSTGNVIFDRNAQLGLAPASCQKVITSASAFELLGKDFHYKTLIGSDSIPKEGNMLGNLFFVGNGDPTLGSWRWKQTSEENVLKKVTGSLRKNGVEYIQGNIYSDDRYFSYNPVPDGWIWQDIGNYYGAGAWGFNWRENQYDLVLASTNTIGERAVIVSTNPPVIADDITNLVRSAKKGSGDNVYLYAAPYSKEIFASGTIPVGENKFIVAGALPNPPGTFLTAVSAAIKKEGIGFTNSLFTFSYALKNNSPLPEMTSVLDSIISPSFDSMNFWFLKRSVNLYGEAFVKTIAAQKTPIGSTDSGIAVIRRFWKEKGIDPASLKIQDGSGLSPANRVTTNALVSVLQYAKKQPWFNSFYNALPEMNGIKMKDGYIGGVRSYTGYVKSKDGKEYTFSFIVNNFDGNPGTVREKMWKVLDLLK
ncbi:D-alanyl-D-alanine carboxypeptidase/D-alanyl-D-alanine-endopeptidase [Ferruginibacter sp. HRS2-29]|uniref:D-alanyl-D-alanine carboxypeptidase/D-alanyl-D-alanine endopeptidase n=2 Tax=Ferruginibacter sp. HRS2-29 TaxID=2487334 RepID=UPI0020CE82C9|nr:D-alanyl-D-alanine carboxypeptidase/D-alanyl-D-alanine-endopeptidase [Ferruginibacter sp. HRS2-29]